MVTIFQYDNQSGRLELNTYELLLFEEFNKLMDPKRNRSLDDPEGKYKERAFREFTYIYLMLDWKSLIADWPEQKRDKEARRQSKITDEEYNDPDFRAACRKYKELKESTRTYKLLQSTYNIVDKLTIYFNNVVDLNETTEDGKPVYKAKDVIAEAKGVGPLLDEIRQAEARYKKDLEKESKIKGDYEPGFLDIR